MCGLVGPRRSPDDFPECRPRAILLPESFGSPVRRAAVCTFGDPELAAAFPRPPRRDSLSRRSTGKNERHSGTLNGARQATPGVAAAPRALTGN